MQLDELTPAAEKLLREILDNRLDNGDCNTDYWEKRFEGLSFAEDQQLRSIFKELSDAEMISTYWASDLPYVLTVLNNGSSYFGIKEKNEKREKKDKRSQLRHDILLLAIGALFGGIVEFLLFKLFGIGG